MSRALGLALASLALAVPAVACRTPAADAAVTDSPKPLAAAHVEKPHVVLSPPGADPVTVSVEVASHPEERQRGLMYRKELAPEAGMLFLFDRPQQLTFWMHNTLVPLDMIFIKSDWTVLGVVENATPLTDSSRSVPGLSQYVLEVNAGFSRRHGIGQGTRVRYVTGSESAAR